MDNKILCNNNCFINKENKIPLEYYGKIFYKYSDKTNYIIIAVDGIYNNTNYKKL